MNLDVRARCLQNQEHPVRLFGVPDLCPRCHKGIHPKHIVFSLDDKNKKVQGVFRCTHQNCQELFLANYHSVVTADVARSHSTYQLSNVSPLKAQQHHFSEVITGVSPAFVEIYNQAIAAEANSLHQIVGIGFRKALEFLVKDFACHQHPDSSDGIKAKMLGKCIEDYIEDSSVKACAKRAAWLGNDETHYLRKWEDKDISDLKLLVKLTVNGIENILLTQKYIEEMS